MTAEDLRELVEAGESFSVEFKGEEREPLDDRDLIETVVCLANGDGGYVVVGVEDDGRVTGARPRHEAGTTDLDRLKALIANNTEPPVRVDIDAFELDGRPVLVITVPNETRVVGSREARYLRRALGGDGKPARIPFHARKSRSEKRSPTPSFTATKPGSAQSTSSGLTTDSRSATPGACPRGSPFTTSLSPLRDLEIPFSPTPSSVRVSSNAPGEASTGSSRDSFGTAALRPITRGPPRETSSWCSRAERRTCRSPASWSTKLKRGALSRLKR